MIRRWLEILFLCRFGLHPSFVERPVTEQVKLYECPRCHLILVQHSIRDQVYVFERPPIWKVARGEYDER